MTYPSRTLRVRRQWIRQAAALVVDVLHPNVSGVCSRCRGHKGLDPRPPADSLLAGSGPACPVCEGSGRRRDELIQAAVAGASFDVAQVREACEALVAEGERRAAEHEVFENWTQAEGRGPEAKLKWRLRSKRLGRERGHPSPALGRDWSAGGWPGELAREYAQRGLGPRNAADGPGRARTAQRLLDTLDGRCPWAPSAAAQPDECSRCHTQARQSLDHIPGIVPVFNPNGKHVGDVVCSDCEGTGCNLAGHLPEVEDSAESIVSTVDALASTGTTLAVTLWQARVCRHHRELVDVLVARAPTCPHCHGREPPFVLDLRAAFDTLTEDGRIAYTPATLEHTHRLVDSVLHRHGINRGYTVSFDRDTRSLLVSGLDDLFVCGVCRGGSRDRRARRAAIRAEFQRLRAPIDWNVGWDHAT